MSAYRLSLVIFLLLALLFAAQIIYYYPKLPDTIASHFNAQGQPDGYSPKAQFTATVFVILAVLIAVFLASPIIIKYTPHALINLPRKDYWLAPERKKQTIRTISESLLWLGSATLLFLWFIIYQTIQVNLGKEQLLSKPLSALVAFLIFTAVWCGALVMKFAKKPQ